MAKTVKVSRNGLERQLTIAPLLLKEGVSFDFGQQDVSFAASGIQVAEFLKAVVDAWEASRVEYRKQLRPKKPWEPLGRSEQAEEQKAQAAEEAKAGKR